MTEQSHGGAALLVLGLFGFVFTGGWLVLRKSIRAVKKRQLLLCIGLIFPEASCTTSFKNPVPPPDAAFYLHEGVKIHFKDIGTGSPLVFLHGFGASLDSWRFMVGPLGSEYRLVLLDLKGHGYSDKPRDGEYSVQAHARVVMGLIRHLGLDRVILVGHSYGSVVALAAALESRSHMRGLVSGLALISGSVDVDNLPFFLKLLRAPLLGWLSVKLTPASYRTRLMLKRVYNDDHQVTDSLVELYAKYQRMPGAEYALLRTAKQMVPSDVSPLEEGLRKLEVPVVNIRGREDKVITRASAEGLCRLLPQCALIELDNVGHIPQEEAPERVVELLKKFSGRIM